MSFYSKKTVFRAAVDFDSGSLAVYMEKIAEQNQLLGVVRLALPSNIAKHINYCVQSRPRLLIYTESAVWASQIRFYHEAILSKLLEVGLQNISQVSVRIMFQFDDRKKSRPVLLPSAETVQSLLSSVDQKSDDVLDRALTKLAETLKRRIQS